MRQSRLVAQMIGARRSDVAIELVSMTTRGDLRAGPLAEAGGKGLFTRELESALRSGKVHLAVHSAKDMPAVLADEFVVAAVRQRGDPRDALVSRAGGLDALPSGAAVGTGSLRRRAQLLALRDDLEVVAVRGNVETRIDKALGPGAELHAVVLAAAGLERSGQAEAYAEHVHLLPLEEFIPAAGQGILAVEALAANAEVMELVGPVTGPPAGPALEAERRVLRGLGADCHSCVAVYVTPEGDGWRGRVMVARPDGADAIRLTCAADGADETAAAMLEELLRRGATELLAES